ncbi:hypothetical protein [Flavobacterium sp.]|uniref:hypothetical protein n=1 Tax=Flavobacterium sp. TaxID=239 RepID=UPI00261BA3BF|nr:hypothetical protein [Flavobacterium sp.]
MIITSKYLIPKGYAAMALFPFLLLKDKKYSSNQVLLQHEKIHFRQQAELLILPFYIWYITEYVVRLVIYKNHSSAYKNISFEREAYANENNTGYLKNRKPYSFFKFI